MNVRNSLQPLGCVVETDFELLKQPKRLDLLIIKKTKIKEKLIIFNYFSEHNLISYKSFRDSFSEADIRSLEVYHRSYLNIEKKAYPSKYPPPISPSLGSGSTSLERTLFACE